MHSTMSNEEGRTFPFPFVLFGLTELLHLLLVGLRYECLLVLELVAFELTLAAPLPEAPMRLGEDYFVFRLKDREEATDEGFTDEVRERIADALLRVKRVEAVRAYVHELRARAEQRGEIRIDERILLYGDESQEGSGSDDDREQESMLPRPARPLDTEDIVPA